uniref:Movement protein TGBp3 n=1 Tax=Potato virus X TaxID=12183 RepID=A0A8B0FF27_PVX|nr:triple gene block protein 3 [Potato virus X]QTU69193.1 triple gene block protein 3 [Potato virus X]QTU69263.1 triple gene block protein 3 [Potato virus X]QTU69283.1 triple gene block protein 3 [Potato virus X]QTU69313.1 triple gene block protein 3 [Potato virus X]
MEVNTYLNAIILVLVATIIAVISTSLVRTEPCVIKITGESITVLACKLDAETIRAIADLKPLSVERLSFH